MKSSQLTPVQAFGKRLAQLRREKAFREERDIGPIDVAKAVEAGQSSMSRWENGEVFPNDDTLGKLAGYYGVSRAWLRYGEGERVPAPKSGIIRESDPEREITARPASARKLANGRKGK